MNRRTILLSDDEAVVLLGGHELSLRLQQKSAMRAVKLAGAGIGSAILDGIGQIFESDIADRHLRRIGFDSHRRLSAVYGNLADPRQNADALTDLRICIVVELAFGSRIADHRDIHDRLIVRVSLRERGRAGQIDGKLSLRPRDGCLNVGSGTVEALREIELQHKAGKPLTIIGGNQFQARNLHELALQRRSHIVRHGLGRCARVTYLHLDYGIVDGG